MPFLVFVRPWILVINPPPWLLPSQNFRQAVNPRLTRPPRKRRNLITENRYKGHPDLSRSMPWYCNGARGSGRVLESRLILKPFDARVGSQQLYRSAGLCEIVVLRDGFPVFVGVIDEPFRRNIITIETNAAVRIEIRKGYLDFCGWRSSDLNISK